jgi:hypothetical protein
MATEARMSWPVMTPHARVYTALNYMSARQSGEDAAVHRIQFPHFDHGPLTKRSPAQSVISNKATASFRSVLGKEAQNIPDFMILLKPNENRETLQCELWLYASKFIPQSQVDQIAAYVAKSIGCKEEPVVTPIDFTEWESDQVTQVADGSAYVAASMAVCKGAAQQAYIEQSNGRRIMNRKPRVKAETVEPISDVAMAAATRQVVEESPKELLVQSMMLFGRGMKIVTRQLIGKAREQMTARSSLRRI